MELYTMIDESYNKIFRLKNMVSGPKAQKEVLKHNKILRNSHTGESCFILGNGPSLREDNLRLLQGENVFTVNQACRNSDFYFISPKYHFWVDQNFFKIDTSRTEELEILDCMKRCATS